MVITDDRLTPPATPELLAQARAGDAHAFCLLIEPLQTRLLRQVAALTGDLSLAEDLVSETLAEDPATGNEGGDSGDGSLVALERLDEDCHSQFYQGQIVCALERYRLAHGEYPETLNVLAPQFIETLPRDIVGGRPLQYHRMDDGKFVLYSVGWNEKDDGGAVALNKDGKEDRENGDWVWR